MNSFARFLIRESTVVFMIVLNAVALFLNAFPWVREFAGGPDHTNVLFWIDYICVIYFLVEAGPISQVHFRVRFQTCVLG